MTQTGREPLYAVYPYDGLSIADSPLGYLDHGSEKKEEAFLKVQDYLLSDEAQKAIEATGRRVSLNGVSEQNNDNLIRVIEEPLQLNRESAVKHRQAEAYRR